jgi:hypothetical protein
MLMSILHPFRPFYSRFVYFTAIWYFLQRFGLFWGHAVDFKAINFFRFGTYVVPKKIWQPWLQALFVSFNIARISRIKNVKELDGGILPLDAGILPLDVGIIQFDGGIIQFDGGIIQFDGGIIQLDGGIVQLDGGIVQFDGEINQFDGRIVQ